MDIYLLFDIIVFAVALAAAWIFWKNRPKGLIVVEEVRVNQLRRSVLNIFNFGVEITYRPSWDPRRQKLGIGNLEARWLNERAALDQASYRSIGGALKAIWRGRWNPDAPTVLVEAVERAAFAAISIRQTLRPKVTIRRIWKNHLSRTDQVIFDLEVEFGEKIEKVEIRNELDSAGKLIGDEKGLYLQLTGLEWPLKKEYLQVPYGDYLWTEIVAEIEEAIASFTAAESAEVESERKES